MLLAGSNTPRNSVAASRVEPALAAVMLALRIVPGSSFAHSPEDIAVPGLVERGATALAERCHVVLAPFVVKATLLSRDPSTFDP